MDSDNEEIEEVVPAWKGVSGTVVLLNVFDPIQTNTPKQAYNATCEMLRGYMRESSSQMVGVCLYGTGRPCNAGVEGVRQVFPLKVPDLDDFLKIQVINPAAYGQAKEFKLSDALWHANKMFANSKKLLSSKTVVLLTRADVAPVESDQKPTLKRVVDLVDSGVELRIVNISETDYHVDKFYKILLTEANKGNSDVAVPEPAWQLEAIVKQLQRHSHRHITIARFCLEIGEGLSIGVGLFNMTKSSTMPKKVLTDKDTNQIYVSRRFIGKCTVPTAEDDGNEEPPATVPLLKSEFKLFQTFGGEKIEFTQDEINNIKNPFGPPRIKLLGFKPASVLSKEKWYVNPCYLLYPNESIMEGSTIAFNALHQACTEMSAVAICVMSSRINSKIKIVALSPCTKPLGLDEIKVGFDVIVLPFAENVRSVQLEESDCEMKDTQKQLIKYIMEELTFDYKPDMFENPFLQTLNRAIEALALEEESIQPYKDKTVHDDERYKNIDVEAFGEVFPADARPAAKKSYKKTEASAPAKKSKLEDPADAEELFNNRITQNKLVMYNVAELKALVKSKCGANKGITGLKKDALIKLLYDKFGK